MSLVVNKKAGLKYEILEKFEAGIELFGFEVKSVKDKQGSLDGAYISARSGEVFLVNADIPPFQAKNTPSDYDPLRSRKLLLTKKEIRKLADLETQKGLTMVPISMYNKNGKIKVEIALARGKKKYDKREDIKKRDVGREIARTLKTKI